MLTGALQCKIVKVADPAIFNGSVTPTAVPNTKTIQTAGTSGASTNVNITGGKTSNVVPPVTKTQPDGAAGNPATPLNNNTTTNHNLPIGPNPNGGGRFWPDTLRNVSAGVGTIGGAVDSVGKKLGLGELGGDKWENNFTDWSMKNTVGRKIPDDQWEKSTQYATTQYGRSGGDRVSQLEWARDDLNPLKSTIATRDGQAGLGNNLGIYSKEKLDMTNPEIAAKVRSEAIKARLNPGYAAKAQSDGHMLNFLNDNKGMIGGIAAGAGLLGLGMMGRGGQQGVAAGGMPPPALSSPGSAYQPFAYKTDAPDTV